MSPRTGGRRPSGPGPHGRARGAHALVLDAAQRQALVTIRSLGRARLTVAVAETSRGAPAFRSRWAGERFQLPSLVADPDGFVDGVLDALRESGAAVVIPSHDGSIDAIRRRRDEIERRAVVALASETALRVATDKQRTVRLAERLGVPVPGWRPVETGAQVETAIRELGAPVVIKPRASWVESANGRSRVAPTLAVTPAEACAQAEAIWDAGGEVIVQEWVTGAREAVSVLRAGGRTIARFAQVAHRVYPPLGGSSVARESIPLPADLTRASDDLVEACGLDGYSEIEFRRNAQGVGVLMEINPRLSASVEVAVRSGVDFPRLLYAWAANEPLEPVTSYREGVHVRWLGGDVKHLSAVLRGRGRPEVPGLGATAWHFARDFARRTHYDYVARDDVGPALGAARRAARRRLRALRRD